MAHRPHKLDNVVQAIKECECGCHQAGNIKEESPTGDKFISMSAMRGIGEDSATPREFAEPFGRNGTLHEVPRPRPPGERNTPTCRACHLPSVQNGVSTSQELALLALRGSNLFGADGQAIRSEEVEWTSDGQGLRLLRNGVYLHTISTDHLWELLREKIGMAHSDLTRAARLRLTGNGVVPAQAALAFRTLWAQAKAPGL